MNRSAIAPTWAASARARPTWLPRISSHSSSTSSPRTMAPSSGERQICGYSARLRASSSQIASSAW